MGDALDRARENVTVITALAIVGIFIALNVIGLSTLANVALFVGFPVIVPLVYLLYATPAEEDKPDQSKPVDDEAEPGTETDDEVERLREQYASGKITEVEFEERIEDYLDPDVQDETVPADGAAIEAELERSRNE